MCIIILCSCSILFWCIQCTKLHVSVKWLSLHRLAPPTPAMPTVFATPIPTPPTPSLPASTQASTTSRQPLQPKVSTYMLRIVYILFWIGMHVHVHVCILIPRPSLTISLQLLMLHIKSRFLYATLKAGRSREGLGIRLVHVHISVLPMPLQYPYFFDMVIRMSVVVAQTTPTCYALNFHGENPYCRRFDDDSCACEW